MTDRAAVLVTGASGFMGRRLLERIRVDGEVVAASRGGRDIGRGRGVPLDLRDAATLSNLPTQVDTVVHLAAVIHARDFEEYVQTNVLGTRRMLDYAVDAGARTFVHASTGGVYGSSELPCIEEQPLNPQDDYALSKAQAEMVVRGNRGNMNVVVLRYCAPYDVGTPNPISDIVDKVINREEIAVSAGMHPRYNPLHLEDAVAMSLRAMSVNYSCVLNIAGSETTTFAGIALLAGSALGVVPRFKLIDLQDAIPYYQKDTYLEPTEAYERLAYRPRIGLKAGIARMAIDQAAASK